MIWLYWRRIRLAVLVVCVALGSLATLVISAGFLAGGGRPARGPADLQAGSSASTGDQPGGARRWDASHRGAPPSPSLTAAMRRGRALITAAALACQNVPYHGLQMVEWSGPDGSSTYLIEVWHDPDAPAGAAGSGQTESSPAWGHSADGDAGGSVGVSHAAAGVLSVSPQMLALMRANFRIDYVGSGWVGGRPALVVTLRRQDGTLAAQYWLDRATGLPLRRQLFDADGRRVSEGAFIDLEIGRTDAGDEPGPEAHQWSARPATALAQLRAQGWPVPATLPGNLRLIGLTSQATRSGPVVDASYSDGLSVVSVFMQRGELAGAMPGWSVATVRGQAVYSSEPDERSLAWSAHGVVYTVIADAPPGVVEQVVADLPHDSGGGFWARVGSGLKRIGSWFNPFG
jgi:sigma-E factor negative regulatory protein RseB